MTWFASHSNSLPQACDCSQCLCNWGLSGCSAVPRDYRIVCMHRRASSFTVKPSNLAQICIGADCIWLKLQDRHPEVQRTRVLRSLRAERQSCESQRMEGQTIKWPLHGASDNVGRHMSAAGLLREVTSNGSIDLLELWAMRTRLHDRERRKNSASRSACSVAVNSFVALPHRLCRWEKAAGPKSGGRVACGFGAFCSARLGARPISSVPSARGECVRL